MFDFLLWGKDKNHTIKCLFTRFRYIAGQQVKMLIFKEKLREGERIVEVCLLFTAKLIFWTRSTFLAWLFNKFKTWHTKPILRPIAQYPNFPSHWVVHYITMAEKNVTSFDSRRYFYTPLNLSWQYVLLAKRDSIDSIHSIDSWITVSKQ